MGYLLCANLVVRGRDLAILATGLVRKVVLHGPVRRAVLAAALGVVIAFSARDARSAQEHISPIPFNT
jgi:hypothetical protein